MKKSKQDPRRNFPFMDDERHLLESEEAMESFRRGLRKHLYPRFCPKQSVLTRFLNRIKRVFKGGASAAVKPRRADKQHIEPQPADKQAHRDC